MSARYVTRERAHVDRIATAWAIKRFVDPDATFAFVKRTIDIDSVDEIGRASCRERVSLTV